MVVPFVFLAELIIFTSNAKFKILDRILLCREGMRTSKIANRPSYQTTLYILYIIFYLLYKEHDVQK